MWPTWSLVSWRGTAFAWSLIRCGQLPILRTLNLLGRLILACHHIHVHFSAADLHFYKLAAWAGRLAVHASLISWCKDACTAGGLVEGQGHSQGAI